METTETSQGVSSNEVVIGPAGSKAMVRVS